jgi:hypothetical protein
MRPIVESFFDLCQDFYHASSLYAGLETLSRRGLIEFRIGNSRRLPHDLRVGDSPSVILRVRFSGGDHPLWLVVDLYDQSDVFALGALQICDCYFKRSFYWPDVASLPADLACKVKPFGLNYACRTHHTTAWLLRRAGFLLSPRGLAGIRRLRHHLLLPYVSDFEQTPATVLESTVVFQTRVWEPDDTNGESDEINEGRVAVIRALREAFGSRFRGGLVPTPFAIARYPGEVSQYPSRRRSYIAMSKRNVIGVYTRGLNRSSAYKLAEYLAGSQCIVAEPPRNELPVPLVAGKHFLPFHGAAEVVAACHSVLENDELAREMRKANHEYYKSEVEPSSHIRRILEWCVCLSESNESQTHANVDSRPV